MDFDINDNFSTRLGTDALLAYGDILLANGKYSFAMPTYLAALSCYEIRNKELKIRPMYRKLAVIASENEDSDRSIALYLDILETVKMEGKIEEVLYVAESIAEIHCQRGEFNSAKVALPPL